MFLTWSLYHLEWYTNTSRFKWNGSQSNTLQTTYLFNANSWRVQIENPYENVIRLFGEQGRDSVSIISVACSHQYNYYHIKTLRPRQNGRHFPDDIFKCIILNENIPIAIKISLKFFPRGPINNIPALVQIIAWRRPGDQPLSEPKMVRLLTHICVTLPQWVKIALTWNHLHHANGMHSTCMLCRIDPLKFYLLHWFQISNCSQLLKR